MVKVDIYIYIEDRGTMHRPLCQHGPSTIKTNSSDMYYILLSTEPKMTKTAFPHTTLASTKKPSLLKA